MKIKLLIFWVILCHTIAAQNQNFSPFDARHWGVVLEYADMGKVKIQTDITYYKDDKSALNLDVYSPPQIKDGEKLPAIVFLNVATANPGQPSIKSIELFRTWPRIVATQGLIGVTIEVDGNKVHESFDLLFKFLAENGDKYNIDPSRLGVWAASANTIQSGNYIMKETLYPGIKAAVLYYGFFPSVPLRKDLPVLFVVSEGDVLRNEYENIWKEVLKNNAPWTIKMASKLPHAFDIFTDNDESRIVVKETISFWKNHLETVPQPKQKKAIEREILEAQYWQDEKKVVELMKRWFQNNPTSKDGLAYSQYARALLKTGAYTEAESIHKKRLELEPLNTAIILDLVIVAYASGKTTEAESYLDQYSKKATVQRSTYTSIALPLFQIKKHREALQYYQKALAIEARPATYYVIGCCYAQTNENDKAFESLNKAVAAGYGTKQQFEKEKDLEPLRSDIRWKALIENLK